MDAEHPDSANREPLLVVRLSALGDVIHTIPAVVGLRKHFQIAWVVETPYAELVNIVAGVRAVPVSLKRLSLPGILAARDAIRGHRIAVDFQGLIKSALVARLSGARTRYGFHQDFIREKPAGWLMNAHARIDPRSHVVEWNLELARVLARASGVEIAAGAPDHREKFARFADGGFDARGCVVLLPGAGRPEKLWPIGRFREVVGAIGDRAFTVWGPGEEQRARAIGCRMAPQTSLRQLAGILREAALVVGSDTGPLHLAAALGTRVVGLYGPTNPARNGPYGQLERCVSSFGASNTMDAIRSSDVLAAVDRALVA